MSPARRQAGPAAGPDSTARCLPGPDRLPRVTLHAYVLRQLLVGLCFAVGGMLFIAIPGLAISAFQKLGGANVSTILRYLPLVFMELFPYLVPIGFLLSAVSTFGRLAADGEWTALCMAGFNPFKMLVGPLLVALGIGAGQLWLLSEVSPELKFRQTEMVKNSVIDSLRSLNKGRTSISFRGFQLIAQSRDPGTDVFRDVFIRTPASASEQGSISALADSAHLWVRDQSTLVIELRRPRFVLRSQGTRLANVERVEVTLQLDELFHVRLSDERRPSHRLTSHILASLRAGELDPELAHQCILELHRRGALSATYLTFLILGAATGLLLRRGTQLGALAVAVGYGLLYYLVSLRFGDELAESHVVPAWMGPWSSHLLGLAAGTVLSWKAFRR